MKRLNESLIDVLARLENIYRYKNVFKSRAYKKAQETLALMNETNITDVSLLENKPNIGKSIYEKLVEYVQTGDIKLNDANSDLKSVQVDTWNGGPEAVLMNVYGIGPKKAKELVAAGITTIPQLRAQQHDVLNAVQRIGLLYYEDILKRIPRDEIDAYNRLFKNSIKNINKNAADKLMGEIVGSYRRGAETSGDIDVILTCNKASVFNEFIDDLIERGVIIEVLSRGSSKCLVITRLHESCPARRVDFLFTSAVEYPFAVLYFTGSKNFNTVMRAHALKKGFTMNEHGIKNKTTGAIVQGINSEKAIFEFLDMTYVKPEKRV